MPREELRFEFTDRVEVVYDEHDDGPPLTRVTIGKRYAGVFEGTGSVEVLTAQGDGAGAYVASERLVGTLHGRAGTFVIQHGGRVDEHGPAVFGAIVPCSGTAALQGIAGEATEAQEGVLALDYTLPAPT